MTDFPTIATIAWKPHPRRAGERALVRFSNGYTASVLRGGEEHGHWYTDGGTYEVAALHGGYVSDTEVTPDGILEFLTEEEANQAFVDIAALPPPRPPAATPL